MFTGSLEVRRLKEFNLALLGMWCWRMLVDRSGFWYRVLVARYGEVGGRLEVGRIRDGGGDIGGGWFAECVSKKLGNGSDTLFWYDKWLGSVSFCERFPRLFDLSENKSITVAGLFSLSVERGGEASEWRRRLWAWEEEELEECRTLLTDVSFQDFVSDRWVWLPDPVEGYTVRGSYPMLTTRDVPLRDPALSIIWHNHVPLKVSLFS